MMVLRLMSHIAPRRSLTLTTVGHPNLYSASGVRVQIRRCNSPSGSVENDVANRMPPALEPMVRTCLIASCMGHILNAT